MSNSDADGAAAPSESKRPKTTSLMTELLNTKILEDEEKIKMEYKEGLPYPHAQINSLFRPDFLNTIREEIKANSKVNFKESDLFRVFQSIDLANLSDGSELSAKLPAVMKLRRLLYSQEWRSQIEHWAGLPPSTLIDKIDCACNCHAPGCHLLCHDDVIGTRKISYIIYLTEPDWDESEGGSLELYSSQTTSSSPLPAKRVWPDFNSMAFFEVQPGFSFHAVQEVVGNRPRLSLQGWYHASSPPENIEQATLQQLKSQMKPSQGTVNKVLLEAGANNIFSEADRKYLSSYVNAEYLSENSLAEIAKKFEEDSSVQLRNFFLDKWVPKLVSEKTKEYNAEYYQHGISSDWKVVGPAHMQRFLGYQQDNTASGESQIVGSLLSHIKEKVMESPQMARLFKQMTSLVCESVKVGQIRRFRPGLDYTVAHYGLLVDQPVLDATVCFVHDADEVEQQAWESGDVGGFECYIEADDDESQNDAADEYNDEDDTQLLSVSASNNTLSLVYRDPGTLRFVKYVGFAAPSSRYDICMEYHVPPDDEGGDEPEDSS